MWKAQGGWPNKVFFLYYNVGQSVNPRQGFPLKAAYGLKWVLEEMIPLLPSFGPGIY